MNETNVSGKADLDLSDYQDLGTCLRIEFFELLHPDLQDLKDLPSPEVLTWRIKEPVN